MSKVAANIIELVIANKADMACIIEVNNSVIGCMLVFENFEDIACSIRMAKELSSSFFLD